MGLIDELPYATKDEIGCALDYSIGRNRYIGYLMSIPTRAFRNYRVGLDCANGASSAIAKSVFDALGAKTYVINSDPDGLNINTNCGSTHIEVLQQYVKENALDIGFAYDGDADRCICVDEFGRVVDGDLILYVCGKYLKDHGELANDTVVTTIMSNLGLYKAFDKEGIKYEKIDEFYEQDLIFNDEELYGYKDRNVIEVDSNKNIYDHVIYDSVVEKDFAVEAENDDDVILYAKLPSTFKIDTPIGYYNPDWALVLNTDEGEKLYFVAETKGTENINDLKGSEKKKILCGRKHFEVIDNGIKYEVVKELQSLKRI